MSFVQELRNARTTTVANYHVFLLQYDKDDKYFYVFFEGFDDEALYVNYLQNLLPEDWSFLPYKADNKDDIYKIYSYLDWSYYSKNKILFFPDKDLEDIIPETYPKEINIFVTEFYSIENYVTTRQVLTRYIREICNFTDVSRIEPLLNKLDVVQSSFYKKCLPLMAWIILMRRNGKRPVLQNIHLQKFFSLNTEFQLKKKPNFIDRIKTTTGVNIAYSRAQIESVILELKNCDNPKKIIRGKFDLWIFVKFLELVPETLNQTQAPNEKAIVSKVSIGIENAVKVLAPRVPIPKSLEDFLKFHIKICC